MSVMTELERRPPLFSRHVRRGRRFQLDAFASSDMPLAVVRGGHEYCTNGPVVCRSHPPCHSVGFVVRGRGSLHMAGTQFGLDAGTIFSCGPSDSHRMTFDAREPLERYFVDLTGPRVPGILRHCHLTPGTVSRVSSVGEVQAVFDNLIRDGVRETQASSALCAALAEYLLVKVADLLVAAGTCPSPASVTFQRCREYIATHFRRLRSLEQVATECDINQAYLCRLFRRFDHEGPYRFLLRLKMNFAADQLRDPKVLVKEAAAAVGFHDPFQFSHTFKNIFGMSPDTFRRVRTD